MSISKKHYVEIAKIIFVERNFVPDENKVLVGSVLNVVSRELASMFKRDNPEFNRTRFLEACGVV